MTLLKTKEAKMKILIPILILLTQGCATISDKDLSFKLKGMTEQQLYDCAGVPDRTKRLSTNTYLIYERQQLNVIGLFTCTAEIGLKSDQVVFSKIRVSRDNAFGAMRAECSAIFESCGF